MDPALQEELLRIRETYPIPRSALMPAFYAVQAREGYVSEERCRAIAELLEVAPAYAFGVLTFYTQYRTAPPGRHVLQLCRTLSCEMSDSEATLRALESQLGVGAGETTADGAFTLLTCECLASCGSGPALLLDGELHERVTPDRVEALLAGVDGTRVGG